MKADFAGAAQSNDYTLLVFSDDKADRVPTRCIFEDVADKNPTVKTAITGTNERFSYTHSFPLDSNRATANDVMELMKDNPSHAKGRIKYIIRPTSDVTSNINVFDKNVKLEGLNFPQDITTHNQIETEYKNRLATDGLKTVNSRLMRSL